MVVVPNSLGRALRRSRYKKRSGSPKEMGTGCDATAQSLGEAFFSLPEEIIVEVLCHLSQTDIFALRLTSRPVCSLLQAHAIPITRSLLMRSAQEHTSLPFEDKIDVDRVLDTYVYIQTIYPPPLPCNSTDYLMQMLRRQSQIDRMLAVTASYIQVQIYMLPSCPRFADFGPYKLKLIRRLHLAAWTLYHFLEKYREMLILEHPNHPKSTDDSGARDEHDDGRQRATCCPSCTEFVDSLLPLYPGTEVIRAYYLYELCRQHLRSLTRPPSYAGMLERGLRRRSRKPPSQADIATFVVLGGIPELCKLSLLEGTYNERIEVVGSFVDQIREASKREPGTSKVAISLSARLQSSPIMPSTLSSASAVQRRGFPEALLQYISQNTLAAVPDLDDFIGSLEWMKRIFQLVGPGGQIVNAFAFVQNVLAGKGYGKRNVLRSEGESLEESGETDVDFLPPMKEFD